jgi:hypothetical protein
VVPVRPVVEAREMKAELRNALVALRLDVEAFPVIEALVKVSPDPERLVVLAFRVARTSM